MLILLSLLQKLICQTCNWTVQWNVLEIRWRFTCSSLFTACHAFPSQGKSRIHIGEEHHLILFRSRSSTRWNILLPIERTNCKLLLVTTHIHSQSCYVIAKWSQRKVEATYYIKDAWEIKLIRTLLHKQCDRRVKDYLTLSCIRQSHYVIFDKVPGSQKKLSVFISEDLLQKPVLCDSGLLHKTVFAIRTYCKKPVLYNKPA